MILPSDRMVPGKVRMTQFVLNQGKTSEYGKNAVVVVLVSFVVRSHLGTGDLGSDSVYRVQQTKKKQKDYSRRVPADTTALGECQKENYCATSMPAKTEERLRRLRTRLK